MLPVINRVPVLALEGFLREEWEIRCWLHTLHQELCVGSAVSTSQKRCDSLYYIYYSP